MKFCAFQAFHSFYKDILSDNVNTICNIHVPFLHAYTATSKVLHVTGITLFLTGSDPSPFLPRSKIKEIFQIPASGEESVCYTPWYVFKDNQFKNIEQTQWSFLRSQKWNSMQFDKKKRLSRCKLCDKYKHPNSQRT